MAFHPFLMDHLTNDIIKKAEVELGETPDVVERSLEEIRELIRDDVKLNCPTHDAYLLQFLRAKKFNAKKAFSVIRNYFLFKKNAKDVFDLRRFEVLTRAIREEFASMLPYRDEGGACILLLKCRNWNVNEVTFSEIAHAVAGLLVGSINAHPATQVCGLRFIVDVKGLGLNHIFYIRPRILRLIAKGLSKALPIRIKGIHVINESIVVTYAWSIVKFAFSEKLRKRVYFHTSDLSNLHSAINPKLLPEDLGGSFKPDYTDWIQFVEDKENIYEEFSGYGYDSSK